METISEFLTTNINAYLLFVIVMGGIFITKYTREFTKIKDVYKVFLASILFSLIFYFFVDKSPENAHQYLFTYLVATSFYELIVKWVLNKFKTAFKIN